MLIRELRRLLASLTLGLTHLLTPRQDTETQHAIRHVAATMKRAQG